MKDHVVKLLKLTCEPEMTDDGLFTLGVKDIKIYSPEEALEHLIGEIDYLKNCMIHDHREDIATLERFRKSVMNEMSSRWN